MGRNAVAIRSGVAILGTDSVDLGDVLGGDGDIITTGNPVLGAGVSVSKQRWGELGHNVVGVSDPVHAALVGHVSGQRSVTHARLAIGVLYWQKRRI